MATFSEIPELQPHMFAHYPGNQDHRPHLAQRYLDPLQSGDFMHGLPLPEASGTQLSRYLSPSWPDAGLIDPYATSELHPHDQFVNQQASFFREQPPTLRRQDDTENSCRPRLTSEQTASLENAFNHNPRPTTLQKKDFAIRLRLTQEKVNNWFQNRRAKTKHQTKTQKSYEVLAVRPQPGDDETLLERSDSSDSAEGQIHSFQVQEAEHSTNAIREHQGTFLHRHALSQEVFSEPESFEAVELELSRQSSNLSAQQASSIADCTVLQQQQFWEQVGNTESYQSPELHPAHHSNNHTDMYHSALDAISVAERLDGPKHTWSSEVSTESFTPANMHEIEQDSKKLPAVVNQIENSYNRHLEPAQMQTANHHHPLSQSEHCIFGAANPESSNTGCSSPQSCSTQISNLQDDTPLQSSIQRVDHEDCNTGIADSWTADFDLSLQTTQPSNVFSTSHGSVTRPNELDYTTIPIGLEEQIEGLHQRGLSRESERSFGASYSASPEEMSVHDFGLGASRRGSITSEIANTMNSVHFANKFSSEGFHSPNIPHRLSIAARRHMHPTALSSSRTVSASLAGGQNSPSTQDRLLPHHVRRIRSVGNCTTAAGRIQKPMAESTFRSPLKTALRESKALDSLVSIVDRVGSQSSNGYSCSQNLISSPNEPDRFWQMSPPSEAEAPPLSATFTQRSFDEGSYANSPPITPFTAQPQLMGQWAEQKVAQSAPAHTTVFSGHSPLMQAQPGFNTTFHSPQPQHPINLFFDPAQGLPMRQYLQSNVRAALHPEQQQVFRRPSSSDGQITFATKPQQEPPVSFQFSMVTYPPAPVSLPLRCNGNFTFQNFGVREFEESTKLQLR